MNSPEKIVADAAETPSMLDEKKYLEERRRRLEASLHDHVAELRDRSREAGRVALIGAGALFGIWALAKTVSALSGGKKHKRERALKQRVALGALGPASAEPLDTATTGTPASASPPPHSAASAGWPGDAGPAAYTPPAQAYAPHPAEPSVLQVFLQSEAGKMFTNQMVALLMVFVTKKLQEVLKLDGSADIGPVKESELARYRRTEPQEAMVIDDSEESEPIRNAPPRPPVV